MAKLVNSRIQQKYDTSANWKANNPILLKGEIGIESDTRKIKVGNGSSAWNSLSYISADSEVPSIPSNPTFSTIYFEDSASSLTGASLTISNYVVSTSINATQVSMTTPDGATNYQAEKISRKNEGKTYTYTYPSKTGTFALTNDFKTINGKSIIGSGDITISASLPSYLYDDRITFSDGTVTISDNKIENRNLSGGNVAIVHENSFHVDDGQTSTKYKVNNIERVDGVTEYLYTFPNKSGTIALTSDITSGGSSEVTASDVSIESYTTLNGADNVEWAFEEVTNFLRENLSYRSVASNFYQVLSADESFTLFDDSDSSNKLTNIAFDIEMGRAGTYPELYIQKMYRDGRTEVISFKLDDLGDGVVTMITPSTFAYYSKATNEIEMKSFTYAKINYAMISIEIWIQDSQGSGEYVVSGQTQYNKYTGIDEM